MYSLFEREVEACLAQGLVLPAYDNLIKCSHAFNVLDARGAIGVTERQAFISRTRELARRVAGVYLEQRQRLEYPFLKNSEEEEIGEKGWGSNTPYPLAPTPWFPAPCSWKSAPKNCLLPTWTRPSSSSNALVPALLGDLRLNAHGEVRILGTPRRLVVYVEDI